MSAVTAFKSNVVVTVVDIDRGRIGAWKSGSLPIYEPGLHDIVRVARDGIRLDGDNSSSVSIRWRNGRIDNIKNHGDYTRHPNLFFSTEIDKAIEEADLIFLCVNTPTKRNGVGKGAAADLGFVEAATRNIAKVAKEGKIVVEKSTVPCKTAQHIREIVSFLRVSISISMLKPNMILLSALGQWSTWRSFRCAIEPRVSRRGNRDKRSARS